MKSMNEPFKPNERYSELLLKNSAFHRKVRAGRATYQSAEWQDLQKELTQIEVKMSSEDIIKHAEHLFPQVGEP